MNSNFVFFSDGLTIEKGKDSAGKPIMRLGGIASTIDKDTDGEYLDPTGFDVSYLRERGLVNWHHGSKTNPDTIIGEPSKVELTEKGLYIEAELYPDSKIAKSVYELANTLKKSSKTRRLGFSIEGKALERSPINDKYITKAAITGVAITHMPKNPNTFADVIKGQLTAEEEQDALNELSLEIMKAKEDETSDQPEVEEGDENTEKACTTESTSLVMKESLDKDLKDLTKGMVFERIFSEFPDIDINRAKKIHRLIQQIATMDKRTAPTESDIEKALGMFGINDQPVTDLNSLIEKGKASLDNGDSLEDIEKGMLIDGVEDDMIFQVMGELKKGDDSDEEEEEEMEKGGDEEEEGESEDSDDGSDGEEVFDEKKESKSIKKGEEDLDILKAIETMSKDNRKVAKATGTVLQKLLADNEALQKGMSDLEERLEKFEGQSLGRKSAPNAKAIEKSFQDGLGGEGSGKVQVSKSRQRGLVLDILEKAAMQPIEKGISNKMDPTFEKALSVFESSGMIPEAALKELHYKDIEIVA